MTDMCTALTVVSAIFGALVMYIDFRRWKARMNVHRIRIEYSALLLTRPGESDKEVYKKWELESISKQLEWEKGSIYAILTTGPPEIGLVPLPFHLFKSRTCTPGASQKMEK